MARKRNIAASAGCLLIAIACAMAFMPRSIALADDDQPTFLVAKPDLPDPLFAESVVLMLPQPAIPIVAGVIINKPTTIPVKRAFPHSVDLPGTSDSVYFGGPVDLETMLLVRRTSKPAKDERRIFGDLYLSVDSNRIAEILKDPALDTANVRVFQGYSEWSVPQLAREKQQDSWYDVPVQAASVFAPDPLQLWKQMVARAKVTEVKASPPNVFRVLLSAFELPQP
jgi:putative transcriptional regulator